MKNIKYIVPVLIVLGTLALLALLGFLVYVAAKRNLTSMESVLLQIISLAVGVGASFFIGQWSARKAAKPHARSAFRRLLFLYQNLSRAATAIKSSQSSESDESYQVLFARLEEIIIEQLATADDALDDWNDIVPEDVAELKQKLQSDNTTEDRQ